MKRSRLRRQSAKRAQWTKKYCTRLVMDAQRQSCADCGKIGNKDSFERHHPFGRVNERLLAYLYLCHGCHKSIHDLGSLATSEGWLQPEFRGMQCHHERVFPWKKECELNWPENLKRENL